MADGDAVLSQVNGAFADTVPPSREAWLNTHCEECIEVANTFGGRPWPDISVQDVVASETALLTAAAWRYYLPAMIRCCVGNSAAAVAACDFLVYQLEPPEPSEDAEWFAQRAGGFTEAQRQAIVSYLVWYRDREKAEYAALEMEPPVHVARALAYWTGDSQ